MCRRFVRTSVNVGAAGDSGHVCLWDLANLNPVVQRFDAHANEGAYSDIQCLAIEPQTGTLIGGGQGGLTFWNLHNGKSYIELF